MGVHLKSAVFEASLTPQWTQFMCILKGSIGNNYNPDYGWIKSSFSRSGLRLRLELILDYNHNPIHVFPDDMTNTSRHVQLRTLDVQHQYS